MLCFSPRSQDKIDMFLSMLCFRYCWQDEIDMFLFMLYFTHRSQDEIDMFLPYCVLAIVVHKTRLICFFRIVF